MFAVAFSADRRTLATGGTSGGPNDLSGEHAVVQLWSLRDPHVKETLPVGEYVQSIAISPDGRAIAAGLLNGDIRLWDRRDLKAEPTTLHGHEEEVTSVAFSPDSKLLASGSSDTTIRLWDMRRPRTAFAVLSNHRRQVNLVVFSRSGKKLASASDDGTIVVQTPTNVLADKVCMIVWRNLSMQEWNRYVGNVAPYVRTCPNLPRGKEKNGYE